MISSRAFLYPMNKAFTRTILEMSQVDQAARFAAVRAKAQGLKPENLLIYAIDTAHNYRIKELIKEHGYPRLRTVGGEALRAFWLLIQHQDLDLALQKNCLRNCDFEPNEYAHLFDRIAVNESKPQRYGTQLNAPIADVAKVNAARKKIGLPPLQTTATTKKGRK